MYNAHNYEFTSVMFILATVISFIQLNPTILPKLSIFNITTTKAYGGYAGDGHAGDDHAGDGHAGTRWPCFTVHAC